uniref:C-type lectin domain-containing protein n=1 Tax=Glossina brevipalpis TaxID=37001 RepID=A0A1A9WD05_9MUSC
MLRFYIKLVFTYCCVIFYLSQVFGYAPSKAYFFENENFLPWHEAEEFCNKKGMHLFTISNEGDHLFLKNFIQQKYNRLLPYWTGAYKVSNTFTWHSTGEPIKYFIWHENEPNDKSGDERCIHTWENDFDWNDNDCIVRLPFICEI